MTSPRIGGKLEAAAPQHSVHGKDRLAILSLLTIAVFIHAWLILKTNVPARDGLAFSRLALQLESPIRLHKNAVNPQTKLPIAVQNDAGEPNAQPNPTIPTPTIPTPTTIPDVLRNAEQPPGFPLAILAVSKIVRLVSPITENQETEPTKYYSKLGEKMLLSGQIACSIGGVLLVVPMYLLGRMIGNRFAGFSAALLFQCMPVPANFTADCLSEGLFLLGLLMSVWLVGRGLRRGGLGNFLAAGLITGATYLIRPEALLIIFVTIGMIGWMGINKTWKWNQAATNMIALFVGVALTASPYMFLIGGLSNKPSEREFMNRLIGNPKEKLGLFDKPEKAQRPNLAINQPTLFADWLGGQGVTKIGNAVLVVFKETTKSGHYFVVFLGLLGILGLRKKMFADPAAIFFIMLIIANILLLVLFGSKIGYVSERHTLPIVALLTIFAAASIQPLLVLLSEKFPLIRPTTIRWFVPLVLCAVSLVSTLKPMHANRLGLRKAGEFLATVYKPGDNIVDPFSWSEFYAGLSVTQVNKESDSAKVLYTIVPGPEDKSTHDRLPKLPLAKDIAKAGKMIYHWPEELPVEQAKVLVYKTVR